MSEQEKQLIKKIADFIIIKIINSKTNEVDYGTIARFMNIPVDIIRAAAIKICQCLIDNTNVEDVDCPDDCFEVILKRRIV